MSAITLSLNRIRDSRLLRGAALLLLFAASGLLIGALVVRPEWFRLLVFGGFALLIVALSIRKPKLLLYGLLLYLPFMGFFRRLLIPLFGWSSFDPLVVLPPTAVLLLGSYWVYRTYMRRISIAPEDDSPLFRLLRWFMLVCVLQVFNPMQGNILVGLGGVMFYLVPLFWMVHSRYHFDERMMKRIYCTVFVIGVISALYGLRQIYFGFTDFEQAWIVLGGYTALMVGENSRPFSFFTSAAEYTNYLQFTIVIAWAALLRGRLALRIIGLVTLPLLFYALFMESSRGAIVLTSLAITCITIVNAKRWLSRFFIFICMLLVLVAAYGAITNIESSNDLIAHQVNGLANPLDDKHSTAGLHFDMFVAGLMKGFTMPIGHGLGSTTLAVTKMSGKGGNSEVDLGNMMISNGLIGGILYLLILWHTVRLAFREGNRSMVLLILLGILMATPGSWLTGGNYSTCALVWISIGYLDRTSLYHRREQTK
ncbi:hypothetical protein [Paenibacillus sp. y28]|uniref:hypothetical protein n=1 Tax=Paenibacillus sp. y28 TaxID=3129110 RepID=UPI003017A44F